MTDSLKTMIGLTGTSTSVILGQVTLHDWSIIAAIAAGFATAIWMLVQTYSRITGRNDKRKD
jgi:type IV secretory pathway TrbD component